MTMTTTEGTNEVKKKTLSVIGRAAIGIAALVVGARGMTQPVMEPKIGNAATSVQSGVGFGCAPGRSWHMVDGVARCLTAAEAAPAHCSAPNVWTGSECVAPSAILGKVVTIRSFTNPYAGSRSLFTSVRLTGNSSGIVVEGLRTSGSVRAVCTIPAKGGVCAIGVDVGRVDGRIPSHAGSTARTALEWLSFGWSSLPNTARPGTGHVANVSWNADDSISVHILNTVSQDWSCGTEGWMEYSAGTLSKAQIEGFGSSATTQLGAQNGSYMAATGGGCG